MQSSFVRFLLGKEKKYALQSPGMAEIASQRGIGGTEQSK